MKEMSKEAKEVSKIIDKLKPVFFLQGWNIDLFVHKVEDEKDPNTVAKIHPKNCYRMADLHIYPRFFLEGKEQKLDIIIHEFCHIPTGIQNGLIHSARSGVQVTDTESSYAFEEETSWFEHIIARLIRVDNKFDKKKKG